MQGKFRIASLLIVLAVVALTGCSAPKPVVRPKVYWPPPPAEPKMEWVTTFSSEDSFPKTEGDLLAEKLLGKKAVESFRKPMGVAVDSAGLVYVADLDLGNIMVVDFAQKQMSVYLEGASIGQPVDLAIDRNDQLYVAEAASKSILVFDKNRRLLRSFGGKELSRPTFMTLDEERGRLYVSDILKHQVLVFDALSGDKLFAFGGPGSAPGKLYGPQGIAIDSQGRIFVAEQFNARVQVFDAEGKPLYMFGERGDEPFQFEGPRGLAFDSSDNLFVAETRKASVQLYQADGTPLTAIGGSRTFHVLGFSMPSSVYVDRNDRVYVTDGMNMRMTVWQMLTPAYLAEHPLDQGALQEIEGRVRRMQKEQKQ